MLRAAMLMIMLSGCAAISHPTAPPPPRLSAKTPDEFGRQMIAALATQNADEAMQLFISRDEFAKLIQDGNYERQRARTTAAMQRVAPQVEGAKFVAVYMQTVDPQLLHSGDTPNVKVAIPAYRETRIWTSAAGKLYQLEVGDLLQIDGAWRFIGEPTLSAR